MFKIEKIKSSTLGKPRRGLKLSQKANECRSSYETTREAISDIESMRSVQNFLDSYAGEDKDGDLQPSPTR